MARNEEKAQSMLYRFREAQAAELGLGTRADRRPRMASACKSMRECERWRGEILREISRKVSKIQDAGMTDYEVRDLNDEINKLLREKRHWENQIIALGGANYRRNVAMLDDDGKEVPGTKGYKYFGRAKDLPGVRELFQSRKKEEDEENQALAFYKKFLNQGPSYFGDIDEKDPQILKNENVAEKEAYEEVWSATCETLGLPEDTEVPPRPGSTSTSPSAPSITPSTAKSKRKAVEDESMDPPDSESKRTKIGSSASTSVEHDSSQPAVQAAAAYISFLSPEDLLQPKLPTRAEMEDVLLALRKQALVQEYFGDS
ncbi:Isy1-like splicing factor [Flagelloscypha sp. PMI_526]|nr:Isy1-like splicing factor [Flagelloscypha sp. PMI_526]